MRKTEIKPIRNLWNCSLVTASLTDLVLLGVVLMILHLLKWGDYIWLAYSVCLIGFVFEALVAWFYVVSAELVIDDLHDTIIITKGRLRRQIINIPIENVYALVQKSNVIQNHFGFVDVEIQTMAKVFGFQGLTPADYTRLLQHYQSLRPTNEKAGD
ncbi:MAG: PH domain-containing protein [Lactobacillaceae bacterium]|jgi:uncharacterized membrane protein YdbT with pleckstrin-like domain|nr:PH domain-containing protein [Lactobacillaceae bacterium]